MDLPWTRICFLLGGGGGDEMEMGGGEGYLIEVHQNGPRLEGSGREVLLFNLKLQQTKGSPPLA